MGLVPRLRLGMLRDSSASLRSAPRPALDPDKRLPLKVRADRRKLLGGIRAREPTYEGFAGPDCGDSDPCSPLAGFRVRVC